MAQLILNSYARLVLVAHIDAVRCPDSKDLEHSGTNFLKKSFIFGKFFDSKKKDIYKLAL